MAKQRLQEIERQLALNGEVPGGAVPTSLLNEHVAKAEELANWDFVKSRGKDSDKAARTP